MPKLQGVKPHPAFDLTVSPLFKATAPPTTYHQTTTTKGGGQQPHYPRDYLESLNPVHPSIDAPHDLAGAAMTMLVGSWATTLIAYLNPLWLLDKASYNLTAFLTFPRETIFLRRIILMAVSRNKMCG
jgi:capsular polysaccharide biosynthesis protein